MLTDRDWWPASQWISVLHMVQSTGLDSSWSWVEVRGIPASRGSASLGGHPCIMHQTYVGITALGYQCFVDPPHVLLVLHITIQQLSSSWTSTLSCDTWNRQTMPTMFKPSNIPSPPTTMRLGLGKYSYLCHPTATGPQYNQEMD